MIIKNNNKAVDILKNKRTCWEGQKASRCFYMKKTVSYGSWTAHIDPTTIPSISWEGGTTVNCKCWVERTNTVRYGFTISTEIEKIYLIPSFKSIDHDCRLNNTENAEDGFTFTFGKRDDATSDRTYTEIVQYTDEHGRYPITVTVTQTKRNKYVTKLDNASITTNLIPASGGNVSSGKLTFIKTYNTGETENITENVTFSTVSATTKGTTESGITTVTTIPAGSTTQKQTTIDGVTLLHPSFTVRQAANTKSVMTPESKKTTSVILSVSPTTVYSSGGTVTFTLQRKYTLNKTIYSYTSGSTSGGGSDTNQGPETVNANLTYTITGITNVSSTTGTSYKIPASAAARTIAFKTTYDNIQSNEASVSLKLDGPNVSKPFTYSNLKITEYSYAYATDNPKYHFPASGKTITATDCTLNGTYDWTYTSMENKSVTETVTWTFNDLTNSMYTFTPTSVTAASLGTTLQDAKNNYASISVNIKNLKHTYNGKLYDVKNSNNTFLTASKTATLSILGNSKENKKLKTASISVSVSPTSFTYTGGTAILTSKLINIYSIDWTSGETSTDIEQTDITNNTTFTGVYKNSGDTTSNTFSFTGNTPVIPNILSSKSNRTYTFTGKYLQYSPATTTLIQTGNTVLHTVTFHINSTYAKWSKTTDNTSITNKFSHDTPYTELIPDETPTWIIGSDYKYEPTGKYSLTTTGSAVTSGTLLTNDIDLYVIWTHPTLYIKVTWEPNGGTFTSSSAITTTSKSIYSYYSSGQISCQPKDAGYANVPGKLLYVFVGWSTSINSKVYTTCPISIDNNGKPITFNAIWKSDRVTITWNANGGLFSDNNSSKTLTVMLNSSLSTYSENPSKASTVSTKYSFKGWSKSASGNVVTFPVTATEDTIYYAIYTSTAVTHNVTWSNTYKNSELEVFSDNTFNDKTTSVDYNTPYTSLTPPSTKSLVSITVNKIDVTIYQVAQWFDNNDFKTLISKSSKKVTEACTVYLKYQYIKHRLTLNSGVAKFLSTKNLSESTTYSALIDADIETHVNPDLIFINVPNGKEFIGWSKKSNSTSADISTTEISTTFTISEPTTYYAIFATGVYKINWNNTNSNIAIWADGTKTSKQNSAEYGTKYSTLSAPANLASPIKNDDNTIRYTGAWYTASSGGSLLSNSTSTVTTNPTNVYLLLTIVSYKVTLNPNDGKLTVSNTIYTASSPYVTYTKDSFNLGSYIPTRTNYNFKGWSTNSSATSGSTNTVTISSSITYYATWKQLFTVTWNLNGGNINNNTSNKTESVESGSTVSFTKYTPLKENYAFLGWSSSSTEQIGILSGNSAAITKDTTFYATWAAYGTIMLITNGGTLTVNDKVFTERYIFMYTLPSLSLQNFVPTRDNYTFVGWNEDINATTGYTAFTLGTTSPYTIWSGTKQYYAIWKSNRLTPILLVLA